MGVSCRNNICWNFPKPKVHVRARNVRVSSQSMLIFWKISTRLLDLIMTQVQNYKKLYSTKYLYMKDKSIEGNFIKSGHYVMMKQLCTGATTCVHLYCTGSKRHINLNQYLTSMVHPISKRCPSIPIQFSTPFDSSFQTFLIRCEKLKVSSFS